MRFATILLLTFFIHSNASSQNAYERVDSVMRAYDKKVKSVEDLWSLSYYIRNTFTEDSLRLRAAFIWITENIAYDVEAFEKEDPRAAQIEYVLKNKKGICSGYANLLKFFCDSYKIENEIVHGRARGGKNDVYVANTRFRTNHAWNAVKVNGQWRLIDATWAAGIVSENEEDDPAFKPRFTREFKEFYYFAPPERFALNHYPSDIRWSLVSRLPVYQDFIQSPLPTLEFLEGSLHEISPKTALLEAKVGDTLTFRFRATYPVLHVGFYSKRKGATHNSCSEQKGDWFEAKYPVSASGYYDLRIAFDSDRFISLVYKLKIEAKQ